MNKCVDAELQELLPDLLHESLDGGTRQRVEAHLAACESCKEDLEVLRTVKGAAVFAPTIDVDSIVRQIPPHRMMVPSVEKPKRTRMVSWLVAAVFALAVVGGGGLVVLKESPPSKSVASSIIAAPDAQVGAVVPRPDSIVFVPADPAIKSSPSDAAPSAAPTLALASSADLASLSDGDLVQLMDDMDNFDALPAAEPEPVIAVDSGDSL